MAPEVATAKRLQKDLVRLENKIGKLEKKLGTVETKHADGKMKTERYHSKRTLLKTQVRGFETSVRKIRGKLGKARAAGIVV